MGNGVHLIPCQQPVISRVTVAVIYNSPNNTRIENAEVARHSGRNAFNPFTPDSNTSGTTITERSKAPTSATISGCPANRADDFDGTESTRFSAPHTDLARPCKRDAPSKCRV